MAKAHKTIRTNNIPRNVLSWYELNAKEQAEFDYIDAPEENAFDRFVRYRGCTYDLHEFLCIKSALVPPMDDGLSRFDAYQSDSYFSGVAFRWSGEKCDEFGAVVMATYYS